MRTRARMRCRDGDAPVANAGSLPIAPDHCSIRPANVRSRAAAAIRARGVAIWAGRGCRTRLGVVGSSAKARRPKVRSVARNDPGKPPIDLRRPIAAWQVAMDDGTHFYVDANSGEIVVRRTRWWRFYDFMYGLHLMNLDTREDGHNPLTITLAIAALVMSLLALALLPLSTRWRRRNPS